MRRLPTWLALIPILTVAVMPHLEADDRTRGMPAAEAATCIRTAVREAGAQHAAHAFPPTSRAWTEDERAAATAAFRRTYDFKRERVRGCLTDAQAEAYGRVDIFVFLKGAEACGLVTTPAAAADVLEGASWGSMTADEKPLGPFFTGQEIARRTLAEIRGDNRRGPGSPNDRVCAGYMDLFGPHGSQFAGLLRAGSTKHRATKEQ